MVDLNQEKERILKEIEKVKFEISRSRKMLDNAGFIAKAPKELVEQEKSKLEKNNELLIKLENELN